MTLIPSTFRKLSSLSTGKKLTSSPKFLEIGDILLQTYAKFLFWILWACLAMHMEVSTCRKRHAYLHAKNQLHCPPFS